MNDVPDIKQNANGVYFLDGEQLWDSDILPVCLEHIKEGDTVIDAGAWIGGHTMAYAKKVGEFGTVHAFEPNMKAFNCLIRNCEKTKQVFPCFNALGNQDGMVAMSSRKGWLDSSFVIWNGENEVRMVQLDKFKLAPNFIKMDVEGCELKALKGAAKTIEKYRPKLVVEVNEPALKRQGNTPQQVIDWLGNNSYGMSMIEECTSQNIYNILCVPR